MTTQLSSARASRLKRVKSRRRGRLLFIAALWLVAAIYALLGVATWVRPSTQKGDHYFAVATLCYAVVCTFLAVYARRAIRSSAVTWSRATQSAREAAGLGMFVLVAVIVLNLVASPLTEGLRAPVNNVIPFFAVGALLLLVGPTQTQRLPAEIGRSHSTPSPTAYVSSITVFAVCISVTVWMILSGKAVDTGTFIVHLDDLGPEAALGGLSLILLSIPVAIRTARMRGAPEGEFSLAGELTRQVVALDLVYLFAIGSIVVDPFLASALGPFLYAVTPILAGTLLISYFGSSWTTFVALRASKRSS